MKFLPFFLAILMILIAAILLPLQIWKTEKELLQTSLLQADKKNEFYEATFTKIKPAKTHEILKEKFADFPDFKSCFRVSSKELDSPVETILCEYEK